MPEYLRTDAADWDRRRDWTTVRKELEELRRTGEDCGAFHVRTSAQAGDEEPAATHPETRTLFSPALEELPPPAGLETADAPMSSTFSPAPGELPPPAGSDPPQDPRPSGGLVQTSAQAGGEEPATTHPETRTLLSPAAGEFPPLAGSEAAAAATSSTSPAPGELPPPAGSDPPRDPQPSGGLDRLREAIERMNAKASYHDDSDRRRRWVVEWLTAGADPAARDPEGWTPLHFAAAGSWDPETVTALVDAGTEVDARTQDGWTPLHLAARYGSVEAVAALRGAGAGVNAQNRDGWTPLHLAARYDRPKAVATALVAAGADPGLRTRDGWTALLLAAAQAGRELVESLLAAGSDIGARNHDGATALDLARAFRRPSDVVAALRAADEAAGGSREPSARGVEPPAREIPGGGEPVAGSPWPGQRPSSMTGPAGVHRASARQAGRRRRGVFVPPLPAIGRWRPKRLRPWMGAVAAVIAVVVVLVSLGDDDASSPPVRGELPDSPVATPPDGAASIPADVAGSPEEEDALNLADVAGSPEEEDALNLAGSARRRIQRGLSAAGFEPGPADGRFGPGTREAVRAWQRERGVPATGYLNAEEADELIELSGGRPEYAAAEPGGGILTVRAAPASRVELDGADVGATGATGLLVLSDVQPGRHIVVARKEGHAAATNVVEVFADRAEVVELALAALSGRLTATANVADARLRIEDAGDHRLPLSGLEIPAGSHRVTVSREGFRTVENDVEIRPGELTTLDFVLERVSIEEPLQAAMDQFAVGDYREAAEAARRLRRLRPDVGAVHLLLGTALYYLGQFDQSIDPLERALELGEQVVLPAKHRHGGVGLREGFCRGTITLSGSEIAFRSREDPEHGFSVTPDRVTDLEVVQSIDGFAFRLNASVADEERGIRRRNFDFVHPNATRLRREPNWPVFVLACPSCDASLDVQVALMNYLTSVLR